MDNQNDTNKLNNKEKQNEEVNFRLIFESIKRQKRLFIISIISIFTTTIIYTLFQRIFSPTYVGSFSLLISDPLSNKNRSKGISSQFEELAMNTTDNDIPTVRELLKSSVLLESISKDFDIPMFILKRRILIQTPGRKIYDKAKGIINVSYTDKKNLKLKKILDALSQKYLQTALDQRQQRISDGLSFLKKQAPALQLKTRNIQFELSEFRKQNNLIEPVKDGIKLKEKISQLKNEIYSIKNYSDWLQNIRSAIQEGNLNTKGFNQALETSSNFVSNQGFAIKNADQTIIDELSKVKIDLAKARSKYKPTSEMVKGLELKVSQLEPILKRSQLDSVDTALLLNQGRLKSALTLESKLIKDFSKQPELIKKYENIRQRLDIANKNLEGLVSAREKFQLEIAQTSLPWKLIAEPEVYPYPISPNIIKNLLLGILLSSTISFILALLRDRSNYKYYSVKEIKEDFQIPVLGVIPFLNLNDEESEGENQSFNQDLLNKVVSTENDTVNAFYIQESLRNLSTSIRFLNTDYKDTSMIIISSSIPSEGKTLSSILISKALAENGLKVLLIDADMRKPKVHKYLKIDNITGLSNILTSSLKINEIIRNVGTDNTFDVITAGTIPPNPVSLLSSNVSEEFFKSCKNDNYDIVLIDSPPILGLADASVISKYSDGLILLLSLERVKRNLPSESIRLINDLGTIEVKGIVVNHPEPTKNISSLKYGGYYQDYSYKYDSALYTYSEYKNDDVDKKEELSEEGKNDEITEDTSLGKKFGIFLYIQKSLRKFVDWLDN